MKKTITLLLLALTFITSSVSAYDIKAENYDFFNKNYTINAWTLEEEVDLDSFFADMFIFLNSDND